MEIWGVGSLSHFFQPKNAVSVFKKKYIIFFFFGMKKREPFFNRPVFALTKQNAIIK